MSYITSVELNYLVYRYLLESGLTHSAFVLGNETGTNNCPFDGNSVPHGALINLIQKGLQYLEMEVNLACEGTDTDDDFTIIQPLDLITKDVAALRQIVNERKKSQHNGMVEGEPVQQIESDKEDRETEKEKEETRELKRVTGNKKTDRMKEREKDGNKIQKKKQKQKQREHQADVEVSNKEENSHVYHREHEGFGGSGPMVICTSTPQSSELPSSDVIILEGHTSEVCACTWSPSGELLASGSGDSTARIWSVADIAKTSNSQSCTPNVLVLKHVKDVTDDRNKDVTTLDWNSDGSQLVTGSYDGQARIWASDGELTSILSKHKGPIFSIKWNKKGDYILSGSFDTTAIVWDVKANTWKQQFECHSGAILDTDWRDDLAFATCSTDTLIHVCEVGANHPIKTFSGHQGEVNSVKWDPTGSLLASCSDDMTAKIWSLKQDKQVHDLRDHAKAIYTIRWSPSGQGTSNPSKQLVLASASFDSTVKIWDVELGRLTSSLNGHRDAVYCMAFSPNAEYLATGSMDESLHIWSLKDSKIVKTYGGNGSIFDICWNKDGDKIAACTNSNKVCVMDFRM